jgi:hypothetical protein
MRTALLLSVTSLFTLALVACEKSDPPKPPAEKPVEKPAATATATAKATAAATASAAPSASAAAAAPGEVPTYASHKVPAGDAKDGTWTGPFEIERVKGHLGLDYAKAMDECVKEGKALCTETQWSRACEADPELAKIETWTASGNPDGRFVVRGGPDGGCGTRTLSEINASVPTRAAVCCDRALGIKTSNKNEAFLKASSKHMLDYEKAVRDRDALTLAGVYADKVSFMGKDFSREDLVKEHQKFWKAVPDQWTLFDTCDISIDKSQTDPRLLTDCKAVFYKSGKVFVAVQRFLRGGSPMKVQVIGDVNSIVGGADGAQAEAAGGAKETKERVGILLLTE